MKLQSCPCCGNIPLYQSVRNRILNYIALNPGCTAIEIAEGIHLSSKESIQKLIYGMRKDLEDWTIASTRHRREHAKYYIKRK